MGQYKPSSPSNKKLHGLNKPKRSVVGPIKHVFGHFLGIQEAKIHKKELQWPNSKVSLIRKVENSVKVNQWWTISDFSWRKSRKSRLPLTETTRIGHFYINRQFNSKFWLQRSNVLHFCAGSGARVQFFQFPNIC